MKKNIIFITLMCSYFNVQSISIEHSFPSQYVTQVLAQKLTSEELEQLRANDNTNINQSRARTNEPDTIIEASYTISRNGDRITIESIIDDTEQKTLTSAEELAHLQETFSKFQQRSQHPDVDKNSRCSYILVSTALQNGTRFNRTVQTSCATTMSLAEFFESIKLYKKNF